MTQIDMEISNYCFLLLHNQKHNSLIMRHTLLIYMTKNIAFDCIGLHLADKTLTK